MTIRLGLWACAVGLLLLGGTAPLSAQTSPYTGQETRDLKALSPEEARALEAGEGMGLARVAELNQYPGPRHVLDLAARLGLTAAQQKDAEQVFADMRGDAVRLGRAILDGERTLEQGFRSGSIAEKELNRLTEEVGRLQGQLRAVHLRAHLRMRALLSPQQVAQYQQARGYTSAPDGAGHPAEHMRMHGH
jgi:Spy/CpxP family protein refolding chaperone